MRKLFTILLLGLLLFSCDSGDLAKEYYPTEDLCVKRIKTQTGFKSQKYKYYIGPRIGKEIYFVIVTNGSKNLDLGDTFYFSIKKKNGSIENFRLN